MKEHYGKGPTAAKSFINDEYVLTVLEGGLTRNEETLLEAGEELLVRDYRLRFQRVVEAEFCSAVERITERPRAHLPLADRVRPAAVVRDLRPGPPADRRHGEPGAVVNDESH